MSDSGWTLAQVSSLLSAFAHLALGLYMFRAGRVGTQDGRVRFWIQAAILITAAWGLSSAYADASAYVSPSYVASALDIARYALWLLALLLLLRPAATSPRPVSQAPSAHTNEASHQAEAEVSGVGLSPLLGTAVAGLLVFAAASLAGQVLRGQDDTSAMRFALMASLALPVLGLVLVEQVFRNLPEDGRWSAKPVCLGLISVFAFDVYVYAEATLLGRLDPDAASIRPLVHLILVPFLVIAIRRKTDWSRSIQVSRRAVFYSAALMLAGAYLLFIAGVGYYVRYFGGDWGRALQLGFAFASAVMLVALVLSASLRARVRVFIGKHFFSYRYDYREEWLAFTAMLASNTQPEHVGVLVVRALANILECPAGGLWTRAAADDSYRQVANWNSTGTDNAVSADASMVSFLRERTWLIDLDEFRHQPQMYEALELPQWLTRNDNAWAVIPLPSGDQLLGFVVLARPRTPVDLDWETRDLVKTASRQAAGYLSQMLATEALLESKKFDAFNKMSAFVVHDLKNIVTQQSLMLKNARRLRDNPEFQEDMLQTVESSLEKMRRLVLQLREGATPPDGARGVELGPLVAKLQRAAADTGRRVESQVDATLATRGHEERLERVLGHLVQNALDATPNDGKVWLKVERYSGQVRVEVGDTGQGMSEDFVRNRLFKPFSSTKANGMGIGTYESAQYIRELGGSLDVDSAPGRGTVISVLLPLFDVKRGSDLTTERAA
jgi:putative PEP-CTERM system histidine kinase